MKLDSGSESWDETLNPQLRGLQVIIVALVLGAMSFLVITVLMSPAIGTNGTVAENPADQPVPALLYIGAAAILIAIFARLAIPRLIEKAGLRRLAAEPTTHPGTPVDRSDLDGQLMDLFQRRQIVAVALIEAPTFLLGLTYLLHRDRLSLFLALIMIAWMAVHFPLQKRVALWLAQRRRMVEDERRLAPL